MQKKCTKCLINKPLECYSKDKSKSDGLYSSCKECKSKNDKKYRINNIEKIKIVQLVYYKDNVDVIKAKSKKWYDNNQERAKESRKKWYVNNFDKVKILREQYKNKDPIKWKNYIKEYNRERYRNNLYYRLQSILSSRIRNSMISQKTDRTISYIGCSIKWFEFQFNEKINWDNQGDIDHVVPIAKFEHNEESMYICNHWSNLRPCEKIENIKKRDKILPDLIKQQQLKANSFIKQFI